MGCSKHEREKSFNETSAPLPIMKIEMEYTDFDSILNNQQYKADAYLMLIDSQGDTLFNDYIKHIKGRGNSTWSAKKKPFTIKLNRRERLLGLHKGKTFCLLGTDESHIRNAMAFDIARLLGLDAPLYEYVLLYINDDYKGLYMMTNKIDIGKHGVNITDLDKENQYVNIHELEEYPLYEYGCTKHPIDNTFNEYETGSSKGVILDNTPEDISGGYLLNVGHNGYYKSISGFVSPFKQYVRIESPKYASKEEVEYISSYFNLIASCIVKLGVDDDLKELGKYLDLDSYARFYLLNEILLNIDGGQNSFYMYKEQGSQYLHAGPVWDFDLSLNNSAAIGECFLPNQIWMDKIDTVSTNLTYESPIWFYQLWRNKRFKEKISSMYINEISPLLHKYVYSDTIENLITKIRYAAQQEKIVGCDNNVATYKEATDKATTFLKKRVDFFDWYFRAAPEEIVCITDITKGRGEVCWRYYLPTGGKITLPSYIYVGGFWNNSPNPVWFYANTDSVIQNGTIIQSDVIIERRLIPPSKQEVLYRKAKKVLNKF